MSQVPAGADWEYVDPDDATTNADSYPADAYTKASQPGAVSRGEVTTRGFTHPDAEALRQKEEKLIRRRARKKVLAKNALKSHLVAYGAVIGMLWVIYLLTGGLGDHPWPVYPMLGWGVGLVSHIAATRQVLTQDDEIESEVQRLRRQLGP